MKNKILSLISELLRARRDGLSKEEFMKCLSIIEIVAKGEIL